MIQIIDPQKDVKLQLGDIVTKDGKIFMVVKIWRCGSTDETYAVKDIYEDIATVECADNTLSDLTTRVINLGYKIYSQEEYKMTIRKKTSMDCFTE